MQIFGIVALSILWLLNALFIWTLHRQWWQRRWVRHTLWIAPLVGFLFIGLGALGKAIGWDWLNTLGITLSAAALVSAIAVLVALPFSGIILTIDRLTRRFREKRRVLAIRADGAMAETPVTRPPVVLEQVPKHDVHLSASSLEHHAAPLATQVAADSRPSTALFQGADQRRRSFLTKTAALLPMATLASAGYGLIRAEGGVRMTEVPLSFPHLHPDLDGLRILHLSDIHIGYYVDLHDLERVMLAAEGKRPDLVLVSGDISDDLSQLPAALRLIAALNPRYGTYASLGNHEYFRGIDTVLRILDTGPIPLLRDIGTNVKIGRADLYIGGADDPVRMSQRERNYVFLRETIDAAFDGAPSNAFQLLMSHRPQGFDVAADLGIDLTVAGHTHGAQVGFNGRSILEPWMKDHYMWGHYQRNGSHLYTSAGVGHWFPFRLGCPPEAPLYVLRRG